MPRGLALNLLASGLTILAAAALVCAATMVGGVAPIVSPVAAQTGLVVEAFYDALNESLRTGNTAPLGEIAAASFIVHGLPPGVPPDRQGLERYLAAVRAGEATVHLKIDRIETAGDMAVVQIDAEHHRQERDPRLLVVHHLEPWGRIDALRVFDGQVAELWASVPATTFLEPPHEVTLRLEAPKSMSMESIDGRVWADWTIGPLFEPRVIYVTAGALTVAIDGASSPATLVSPDGTHAAPRVAAPGTTVELAAGDAIAFADGARYSLWQSSRSVDLKAFTVVLPRFRYDGPRPDPGSPAERHSAKEERQQHVMPQVLVASQDAGGLYGLLTVSFHRVNLPPGASVQVQATGFAFLIAESGPLGVGSADVAERDALNQTVEAPPATVEALSAGSAIRIPSGHTATLVNLGDLPTEAMFVTIASKAEAA